VTYDQKASPHAYDHEAILCPCGFTVGYRKARSADPLQCVQCEAEQGPTPTPTPSSPVLPATAQAFVDAYDNAATRAVPEVTGAAMHVPMALWAALVEARAALETAR
jgi:hypothetical protein